MYAILLLNGCFFRQCMLLFWGDIMAKRHCYYLTKEQVERLQKLALSKNYRAKTGPGIKRGSVSKMLQALADGELTLVKLG